MSAAQWRREVAVSAGGKLFGDPLVQLISLCRSDLVGRGWPERTKGATEHGDGSIAGERVVADPRLADVDLPISEAAQLTGLDRSDPPRQRLEVGVLAGHELPVVVDRERDRASLLDTPCRIVGPLGVDRQTEAGLAAAEERRNQRGPQSRVRWELAWAEQAAPTAAGVAAVAVELRMRPRPALGEVGQLGDVDAHAGGRYAGQHFDVGGHDDQRQPWTEALAFAGAGRGEPPRQVARRRARPPPG